MDVQKVGVFFLWDKCCIGPVYDIHRVSFFKKNINDFSAFPPVCVGVENSIGYNERKSDIRYQYVTTSFTARAKVNNASG